MKKVGIFFTVFLVAAATGIAITHAADRYDDSLFQGLKWRNVGPFRGGRAVTAAGVPSEPGTFYMGATGGGVGGPVNNYAEQRHRSVRQRYYPTLGFGNFESAARFCFARFAGRPGAVTMSAPPSGC